MTALVQSAATTWASGAQGSTKTITLPAAATIGSVVIVEITYSHDAINSVTGLGGTWTLIQSREGSSNAFESAELWYCTVTTASTTITITPNPGFFIDAGIATAHEWSGLSGSVISSSTVSSHSVGTSRTTPALAATAGQLYVGAMIHGDSGGVTITPSPGTFTVQDSAVNGSSLRGISGSRIAAGAETISLTAVWSSGVGQYGIQVAAVFGANVSPVANLSATATLTSSGVVARAGAASLAATSTLTTAAIASAVPVVLTATSSLSAAGNVSKVGVAALVATSSMTPSALVSVPVTPAAVTITTVDVSATAYVIDRSGNILTLGFRGGDDTVEEQPGSLDVLVGNGPISGTVYFYLDGASVPFADSPTDESGGVNPYATIPISGLTVGTHQLSAGDTSAGSTSVALDFEVTDEEGTDTDPTPSLPAPLVTTKWTFQTYDYSTPGEMLTYEFPLNPITVHVQTGEIALSTRSTTVFDGDGLMVSWEGAARPGQWVWTGRVFTKEDHDALIYWASLNQRVWLTDEFSRRHLMKIENLSMTRKRNLQAKWDHEYQMTATVLPPYRAGIGAYEEELS